MFLPWGILHLPIERRCSNIWGDWKCRLKIDEPNSRAGKCRNGKCRTRKCRTEKCRTGKCMTKRFLFVGVKLCVLYRDLIVVYASLYISIASEALMLRTCCLARLCVCLCVCLSVCPESELWQNGWMDADAVWSGEWWVGSVERWV